MKDFLGKELEVGDKIVHASAVSGGLYGPVEVIKIAPKMVGFRRHATAYNLSYVQPRNCVKVEKV